MMTNNHFAIAYRSALWMDSSYQGNRMNAGVI